MRDATDTDADTGAQWSLVLCDSCEAVTSGQRMQAAADNEILTVCLSLCLCVCMCVCTGYA